MKRSGNQFFTSGVLLLALSLFHGEPVAAQRNKADILVTTGLQLVHGGKYHEAMSYFQKALEIDPKNSTAYLNRGSLFYRFDKTDLALKDLDRCIQLKGDSYNAYRIKCKIAFERSQKAEAFDYVNRALKVAPDNFELSDCYRTRGKLNWDAGDEQKALADFNKAVQCAPTAAPSYKQRGNLYMHFKQYEKAIADYTTGLKTEKTERDLYYSLRSQAYEKIGRKDLARADRQKTNSNVMNDFGIMFSPGKDDK